MSPASFRSYQRSSLPYTSCQPCHPAKPLKTHSQSSTALLIQPAITIICAQPSLSSSFSAGSETLSLPVASQPFYCIIRVIDHPQHLTNRPSHAATPIIPPHAYLYWWGLQTLAILQPRYLERWVMQMCISSSKTQMTPLQVPSAAAASQNANGDRSWPRVLDPVNMPCLHTPPIHLRAPLSGEPAPVARCKPRYTAGSPMVSRL